MLRFVVLFLAVLSVASCDNEKKAGLVVSGTIKNREARKIYLEESLISTLQKVTRDSATIGVDGKFSLSASPEMEGIFNLRLDEDVYPFVSLVNDAPRIGVQADFKNEKELYTVSGSAASQQIKDYLAKSGDKLRMLFSQNKALDSLRQNQSEAALLQQSRDQYKATALDFKNYTNQELQSSKSPALSMFILSTYQGMSGNPGFKINAYNNEELLGVLNNLVTRFPERTDIAGVRNSIETQQSKSGWVGKTAPEIALPDTEGNTIKLSSYRGKYVLVDFWASWCKPCRMENPNVVEAYNQFKGKNFTVLGVSLDMAKEPWKKAIVDDNLNWAHISDLKQWNSVVVPMYGIQGIPFNVLVDPEGKIVAENLRGNDLQQKLSEVIQ
jgi:peroxiredoxin